MRKVRRKINRKKRKKVKIKKSRGLLFKHLDKTVTPRFVKITTYLMILLELLWIPFIIMECIWFYVDVFGRG